MGKGLYHVIVSFTLLAHVAIGAHREAMQRGCTLLCPLRQCLRQQREAGHQEQHTLAGPCQLLSNFQARKGLARATSHDQLAAIRGFQSNLGGHQRRFLVISKLLFFLEYRRLVGLILGPVDLAVFQRLKINFIDCLMLV
ncbi:hypothetical protein D9M71_551460 [compost metagenome]